MNRASFKLLDLGRILDRAAISGFLEETARFYESAVFVIDLDDAAVLSLNSDGFVPDTDALRAAIAGDEDPGTQLHIRSVLVYGELAGHVVATPRDPRDFKAAEAVAGHLADLLTELAAREFELNDLSREILETYEEVNLFYNISSALPSVRDVNGVCSLILSTACEIIKARRSSILLLDDPSGDLVVAASRGLAFDDPGALRIPVDDTISGRVLKSRVPQLVDDVEHLPRALRRGEVAYATRSFICVPLCPDQALEGSGWPGTAAGVGEGESAIGVINMADKDDGSGFSSGDLKLLVALASQAAVLIRNIQLVEMDKELRIARSIQQNLLPSSPPSVPGLRVAGACRPARNVGGDYFDFLVRADGNRLAAAVADVSGHNVASAILMAVARSALRGEVQRSWIPGAVLERLNRLMFEDLMRAESFLSVLLCVYEPGKRVLRYSSAGHHPPLLLRPGEGAVRPLGTSGLLVGVECDESYTEESIILSDGDVVLLYTDGLIEARSPDGSQYGADRLGRALVRHAARSPEDLLDAILDEVHAFGEGRQAADDRTVVVLKVSDPERR